MTSVHCLGFRQVYIIHRRETDGAVPLDQGEFYQRRTRARSAYALTACRRITRSVPSAQQMPSEGIENFALDPVEFERTVTAAIQVRMHHAFEANHECRRRLACRRTRKRTARTRRWHPRAKPLWERRQKRLFHTPWDRRLCTRLRKSRATGVGRYLRARRGGR